MNKINLIKEGQEEFDSYPDMNTSVVPDFSQILKQKISTIIQPNLPGFDPHMMMVKKNKIEKGEITPDPISDVKWPERDVKSLEDFCSKYGIMGFSPGRMNPIGALAFLKNKMGIDERPLSERVPYGYEKRGTPHDSNPNFPYNHPKDKRVVLNG